MTKSAALLLAALASAALLEAPAQDIRGRYVSRMEEDGTIYHTLPCTLFEHDEAGDLTFDITYKEHRDGTAAINFTYEAEAAAPADSIRFSTGRVVLGGPVKKIYIEPERKRWKHRYGFRAPLASLCLFFDAEALPEATLYIGGRKLVYRAKRSAWRSYAPVGYKILEMVRVNEHNR